MYGAHMQYSIYIAIELQTQPISDSRALVEYYMCVLSIKTSSSVAAVYLG